MADTPVAVIGGGVVGAAVAYTLARRGVPSVLLEAEDELAMGASGTNSGILHTGFDSKPGELETELILRAAELRPPVLEELRIPARRYGALLIPRDEAEKAIVARVAEGARANGVEVALRADGVLEVPGESATDPIDYTRALAASAQRGGTEIRLGARVEAIARAEDGLVLALAGGDELRTAVAVNAAGLHADAIARLVGDDSFDIYPRKGEFFVFEPSEPLEHILLPVPAERTKGVLVFPTLDGMVVAGPTAHDQEDKEDWSVRPSARDEVLARARAMWPPLADSSEVASYAGLRPAGRNGVNYAIAASAASPGLINAAAIRSTGLTASLGIGERVAQLVAEQGVSLGPDRPLPPGDRPPDSGEPWWRRASRRKEPAR